MHESDPILKSITISTFICSTYLKILYFSYFLFVTISCQRPERLALNSRQKSAADSPTRVYPRPGLSRAIHSMEIKIGHETPSRHIHLCHQQDPQYLELDPRVGRDNVEVQLEHLLAGSHYHNDPSDRYLREFRDNPRTFARSDVL